MFYCDNPGGALPAWLINWAAKVWYIIMYKYNVHSIITKRDVSWRGSYFCERNKAMKLVRNIK